MNYVSFIGQILIVSFDVVIDGERETDESFKLELQLEQIESIFIAKLRFLVYTHVVQFCFWLCVGFWREGKEEEYKREVKKKSL